MCDLANGGGLCRENSVGGDAAAEKKRAATTKRGVSRKGRKRNQKVGRGNAGQMLYWQSLAKEREGMEPNRSMNRYECREKAGMCAVMLICWEAARR